MTDTPEVVVTPAPAALPKSTTPDDLLKMYDEEPKAEQAEVEAEAEKQVKVKEEVPKIEAAQKLAKASKEKEQVEEETKEEIEDAIKAFKAKFNEKEIEVPEEATFTIQINGKEVEFKTKDAVAAFQGKEEFNRNMDRRVGTVSAKERNVQKVLNDVKSFALKVKESIDHADFMSAAKQLGEIGAYGSEFDPIHYEKLLLDKALEFGNVYGKMSEDQKARFFADRRIAYQDEKLKKISNEQLKDQSRQQLVEKLQHLWTSNNVSQEEFWDTWKSMSEKLVGEDKPWKDVNHIQPEDVIQQLGAARQYEKVLEAAEEVKLTDEDKIDAVYDLIKQQPDWTVENIAKVIERSGIVDSVSSEVKNLNRKAEKSGIKTQLSTVSSTEKKNGKVAGVYDKDEWEWMTRHQPKVYRPAF